METVTELLKLGHNDEALKRITELIEKPGEPYTELSHRLRFAAGLAYSNKYENTKPVNNKYAEEAKNSFASADTVYKSMHGTSNPTYTEGITYINTLFSNFNTKFTGNQ